MENPNKDEISQPKSKKHLSRGRVALFGIFGLLLIAVASAFGGYQSGIQLRTDAEKTQISGTIQDQMQLGQQDMDEGRYERARQRFEYVIGIDPGYPGVTELLSEVLFRMNSTATPTAAPTPTVSPTPDNRETSEKVESLFSQAQQSIVNKDWSKSIEDLLQLRKADPNYHAVDIDGMLYISYRNRGQEKISRTDLEGGIYDLKLAERFGPLDSEAQGFLTWTEMYITGASFWEIDWQQAVYYLEQVAAAYPSMTDGSNMSARERYRQALIGWGDTLQNTDDPCAAAEKYQLSLDIGPDPEGRAEAGLDEASRNCSGESDEDEDEDVDEGDNPEPVETTAPVETAVPVETTVPEGEATTTPPEENPTPYP